MPSIYHFTHGKNLELITAAGELRASKTAETLVDIADVRIKGGRKTREVTCGPGGYVGDYVPFYFAPRSPMLYRIQNGGVEGVDGDPRGILYFRTTVEQLTATDLAAVFTDGNAAAAITSFFDDPGLLAAKVDMPLMAERYWQDTDEDGDRVRRRQAECLVHGAVPLTLMEEVGVYDAAVQRRAREILVAGRVTLSVNVRRDWYF